LAFQNYRDEKSRFNNQKLNPKTPISQKLKSYQPTSKTWTNSITIHHPTKRATNLNIHSNSTRREDHAMQKGTSKKKRKQSRTQQKKHDTPSIEGTEQTKIPKL